MRDLSDEFKLSVRSIGEVFQALGAMVARLAVSRSIRFRGKRPTRAAVVNAALLYLDTLPPEQCEQALAVGMRRLESLLETDGEGAAAAPPPVTLTVEDITPGRPASGKVGHRRKNGG